MSEFIELNQIDEAADVIRERISVQPRVGMILGSGLGSLAEAVEGAEVVIAAKANEQGHLFGSVHERDIAENLREQSFEIKDSMVALGEHIKEVGTHDVKIRVAPGLTAMITVVVVSQDENVESNDEDSKAEPED